MSIKSSQDMISVIREYGIIPLFKGIIPGWSIEEMTDPDFWFTTSDVLGPWDWKIDAIREGDIIYGKYISRRASFATLDYYRHLMNWRRSLPLYRVAIGEESPSLTIDDRLNKLISPILLSAIRKAGSLDSSNIRKVIQELVSEDLCRQVGGHVVKYLTPTVKSQAVSFLLQFLEMGTWTIIGDFERVYRGPYLEYNGWQRSSVTTPEEFLKIAPTQAQGPSWAIKSGLASSSKNLLETDCTPEESRLLLASHISKFSRCTQTDKVLKLL